MRKKAITKPVFGKIFIVRFLIWVVIFSIVAVYALNDLYSYVLKREVYEPTNGYRSKIEEYAEKLSKAEPGSDEYDRCLNTLKAEITIYQVVGYNYAEVQVGDLKLATDKDTVYFHNYREDQSDTLEFFFIEDLSYLKPLNDFLKKNNLMEERRYTDFWYRYGRDPLSEDLNLPDYGLTWMNSAYLNREKHTFIPGVVVVAVKDKEYKIDCTPADTKGFEYVDFGPDNTRGLMEAYRVATDLSSKDISYHTVSLVGGGSTSFNKEQFEHVSDIAKECGFEIDNSWRVGFSDYRRENVFIIAPFSSALIILVDIVAAAIVALVFADIKYHREKTVWEIFDYRIKTTEAMAHDLKTPLSTIMFYLENLEESSKDPEKVLEYTKTINDKVVTMDHMIGDILQFSKGETGKVDLKKESVSVKELITESLKEFPEMKFEIKGEDVTLATDKKVFTQVIMNLLSNCDRYGKKGSVVDISIALDALTITNKTDKKYDDVDSLKKPFVKGDDSRGNKGAGLGLAIADNNLALLGYKLELSSESDEFRAKVRFKK